MNAREIIDKLARLDEQSPVEEPVVEPGVEPAEPDFPEPTEPTRRPGRRSNPYEMPPDFDPAVMPRPKAEEIDDVEAIESWLEATQQPIDDWDYDGNELRLHMLDGTVEVYSRGQLEQAGVFADESALAMAESMAEDDFGETPEPIEGEEVVVDGPPEDVEAFLSNADHDEAAGVLDQLLGRSCPNNEPAEDIEGEETVIHVDGEEAEELGQAVTDVVQAIIGIVKGAEGEEGESATSDEDEGKEQDKEEAKKPKAKKKDKDSEDNEDEQDSDKEKDDKDNE